MMVPIKINTVKKSPNKPKTKSLAVKAGIILIALACIFLVTAGIISRTKATSKDTRQAVFTTTGQIYFGYVKDRAANMVEIQDAYYLNSISALTSSKPEEKISLIRMGSEVYKPSNDITINRQHIIFVQDLNKDSQINAAIISSEQKK